MSLQSLQKLRRVLIWMKPTNTWLSPLNSNVSASSVSESYSWVKFANFNIHLPRTETGSRKAIYSNLNLTLFWIWVPPIFYESLWEKWDTIHVLFHVCLLLWGAVLSIQFWHVLAVKLYEYVSLVGTFEFTVFGRVLPRKKKKQKTRNCNRVENTKIQKQEIRSLWVLLKGRNTSWKDAHFKHETQNWPHLYPVTTTPTSFEAILIDTAKQMVNWQTLETKNQGHSKEHSTQKSTQLEERLPIN